MNKQYLTSCSQCGKIIIDGAKIFGKVYCLDCLAKKVDEYKSKTLEKKADINNRYDAKVNEINKMRNHELEEVDESLDAVLDRYQYVQETQKEPPLPAKLLPQVGSIRFAQIVKDKSVCGIRRVLVESLVYNNYTHAYYANIKDYPESNNIRAKTNSQLVKVDSLFETRKLAAQFQDNRFTYSKKLH